MDMRREIIAVFSDNEIHIKHTSRLCGHNLESENIKPLVTKMATGF
jgi:hypothetical protein